MGWIAAERMGGVYGLAGKRDKAEKILRESESQSKRRYIPSSALICFYSTLRDDVRVFEWLGKAYDERDALLPWLNADPAFDWLRSDSRFQDLLRRMRLQ